MPLVNVLVNGRAYTVACDEGEEEHLRELGQYLDKRVRELSATVGQVADSRLLLMAGLVIADELSDAMVKLDERNKELTAIKEGVRKEALERRAALKPRVTELSHQLSDIFLAQIPVPSGTCVSAYVA